MGIEPRHLATLRAVAEAGSFRGAAAELGYVPSAVSAHIGSLERTVGRPLVRRRRGAGVELTDAGLVLLDHAEAILGRLQAAQADMTALGDDRSAPLRVGITQSVGIRALPDIVRTFAQEWPLVRIQPRESETDLELYGGVEQAELDLSFVELPAPPGPFQTLPLLVDPYVLLLRSDSPFAHRPRCPTLTEISGMDLIGHTSVPGAAPRRGADPRGGWRASVRVSLRRERHRPGDGGGGRRRRDHARPGLRSGRRTIGRLRSQPRRATAHARPHVASRPAPDAPMQASPRRRWRCLPSWQSIPAAERRLRAVREA